MIKLSSAQQEQLHTIGTYLKGVREDQGKAIDEIANQIFIRPALVRAIETADSERLPEPVFIQGFIRRYADYLGLDGLQLSRQFESTPVAVLPNAKLLSTGTVKQRHRPAPQPTTSPTSKQIHSAASQQVVEAAQDSVSARAERDSQAVAVAEAPIPQTVEPRGQGKGAWILGLGAIATLAGLLWFITQRSPQTASSPESPAASQEPSEPETASPPPATAETETEASPTAVETAATEQATPDASSVPITFSVTLAGESWLRVVADGEQVYEGILTESAQQTWTAQTELTVRAGNPGVVLYSYNGAAEQPLGEPGAPQTLTFPLAEQ